jgi:hypothetical protein
MKLKRTILPANRVNVIKMESFIALITAHRTIVAHQFEFSVIRAADRSKSFLSALECEIPEQVRAWVQPFITCCNNEA